MGESAEPCTMIPGVWLAITAVISFSAGVLVIDQWRKRHSGWLSHVAGPGIEWHPLKVDTDGIRLRKPGIEWHPLKVDTEGIRLRKPGCECPYDDCSHWRKAPRVTYVPDCQCAPEQCPHWRLQHPREV